MNGRAAEYVRLWKGRGYRDDIPDEVPDELMSLGVAPSYKAIACALLRNDVSLRTLGFGAPVSRYYTALKGIEIAARAQTPGARGRAVQLWLFEEGQP